jgi:hypothetical protein
MSKRLDENIGTVDYDGLIVTNEPVADVVTVTLAESQGVLARGTVITGAAGVALSAAAADLGATDAVYILADETDTGTGTAVTATAYRTGHFARNKLAVASGYTLKATDEEVLRKAGILLSDAIEY